MKIVPWSLGAALAAVISQPALAQAPAYLGAWALAEGAGAVGKDLAAGTPTAIVITQSPTVLNIEQRQAASIRTVRYKVDGTETTSAISNEDSATGTVRFDGANVVTQTVYSIHGFPMTLTQIFVPSPDGRRLTVESRLKVEHGYEGAKDDALTPAPNVSAGSVVYVRQ